MEGLLKVLSLVWLSSFLLKVRCGSVCQDKLSYDHCQDFQEREYCDKDSLFHEYMVKNCPKSCHFCEEVRQDTYSVICVDDVQYGSSCVGWKEAGLCKESSPYYSFMKTYCFKTCGLCSQSSGNSVVSGTESTCTDSEQYASFCPSWKEEKFCQSDSKYFAFMQKNCRATCGICTSGGYPTCGKSSKKIDRVVGGSEASPHTWPWQAALWSDDLFFCGGTLIHEDWVVTASHCILGKEASSLKIILGDHNRFKNDGTEQQFTAIKIVQHPSYNVNNQDNDIALVKLERNASLNDNVLTACLPSSAADASKLQNCYLTGWGKTDFDGPHSETLQEVRMPVVTNEKCNAYNAPVGKVAVTENMICAGYGYDTRQSGCRGDSGGPLVCIEENKWTLRGVVSWGSSQCLGHEKYTVFARVSRFTSWISETIKAD